MEQQAPVLYGKYQLLDLLARGGMAEVYKAKSHGVEGFEKILVIKRILTELSENPAFVDMFINEAKIAVTLSHANIVQVFDLGKADETYFIAMEYVAGVDLATVLRRARKYGKPLPVELAVFIVSEVAKGLDYAHRRRDADMQPLNIVHRDVSPQNVLLSYEGEVKLTDFGIAKARTTVEQETEHGVLKGKYAYMAPEQARGKPVDARTDLFALGTVLYEALAGVNPFLRPSTYDTLQRVRDGEAEPILEVAEQVPEELAAIVHRAMSPSPDDRHENAGRFYEDLIQFLYASGRRVGAHDLGNYLDALRAASEKRAAIKSTDAGLRAAFEVETSAGRQPGPEELTPAEVPSARSQSGSRVTTGGGRQTSRPGRTGIGRAQAEQRDLTALAIEHTGDATRIGDAIRRAGGTVVETTEVTYGVFGVHNPDGHDTEAAARAALSLLQVTPTAAELRMALHAGRGIVDGEGRLEVTDPSYRELLEIAASELRLAGGQRPRASLSAQRALRRFFDLEPVEGGWEIVGERDLLEAYGKFVGRRDPLRRIGEVLAVAHKGKPCVLTIAGEAGIGKTRLLLETVRRLRLGGHDVGMYVTKVPPQSQDVPLSTVQALLNVILGIEEFDADEEMREKVTRLRELGLAKVELDAVSRLLGLGTTSEAPEGEPVLRNALASIAQKLAEDRLTVFAVDDFHNADRESREMLRALLEAPGAGRIVFALAYRPDTTLEWEADHHEIQLGALSDEDVARLTAARLGVEEVPMELLREVSSKSAGNPLYVEEYLLALQDAGAITTKGDQVKFDPEVAAVDVPKSLRGIVAARLARLDAEDRHVVQVAGVIGGRFHDVMVQRVVDEPYDDVVASLERLAERGILVHTAAREYGFAHTLLPEVVYAQLPYGARKELHQAVGEAFEAIYPDHLDELAERLAHHHREGGNRARAIDFLIRAADRLEAEFALRGAIHNLAKAVEMLGQVAAPDRDRMLSLHWRIATLCFRARVLDEGIERSEAAIELAEGLGRDAHLARFCMMRGRFLSHQNRFEEARPWFDRARYAAREAGKSDLLRDVTTAEAEALTRNGEYQAAVGVLQEAVALAREAGDKEAELRSLIPLALAYGGSGDADAAYAALDEAQQLTGKGTDRIVECDLLKTESLVSFYTGDLQRSIAAASRALELAKEWHFPYEAAVNAHNLGEDYLRLGDFKRAFAMLRYSYDVAKEHGIERLQYSNIRVLGFIDAAKLGSTEGRERILEAYEYARQRGMIWDLIQSRYFLAIVDSLQGRGEEGRSGFREVLRLAAEYGQRHYEQEAEKALQAIDAGRPVPMPG